MSLVNSILLGLAKLNTDLHGDRHTVSVTIHVTMNPTHSSFTLLDNCIQLSALRHASCYEEPTPNEHSDSGEHGECQVTILLSQRTTYRHIRHCTEIWSAQSE